MKEWPSPLRVEAEEGAFVLGENNGSQYKKESKEKGKAVF